MQPVIRNVNVEVPRPVEVAVEHPVPVPYPVSVDKIVEVPRPYPVQVDVPVKVQHGQEFVETSRVTAEIVTQPRMEQTRVQEVVTLNQPRIQEVVTVTQPRVQEV